MDLPGLRKICWMNASPAVICMFSQHCYVEMKGWFQEDMNIRSKRQKVPALESHSTTPKLHQNPKIPNCLHKDSQSELPDHQGKTGELISFKFYSDYDRIFIVKFGFIYPNLSQTKGHDWPLTTSRYLLNQQGTNSPNNLHWNDSFLQYFVK